LVNGICDGFQIYTQSTGAATPKISSIDGKKNPAGMAGLQMHLVGLGRLRPRPRISKPI